MFLLTLLAMYGFIIFFDADISILEDVAAATEVHLNKVQ